MKKILIWAAVITLFFITTFIGTGIVNEEKLKSDYYVLIADIGELFKDHAQKEDYFYNRSYSRSEEIAQLLEGRVTDKGFHLIVQSIFDEFNELYVYKPQYQEYISDTRNFSQKQKETNYYDTVRDTILNPALGLIPFEALKITKDKNRVVITGQDVLVVFYDNREKFVEYHRYARFGFPPSDYISFSLAFIYDNGIYLLDDFIINPQAM
ncbi:MAG: hypothetical protein ACK4M9_21655 [Anaerobacillus sp.]|uniref:hypothetical protein n=1 Tax=Anaerobacillus sp. TaxID=1872506 RepID=UPI00391D830B